MDYKTAELSLESIEQLSQLEHALSSDAGEDIVLIAYQKGHINTQNTVNKADEDKEHKEKPTDTHDYLYWDTHD